MRARAGLDLDGDVAQARHAPEFELVGARRLGIVAHQADHRRVVARPEPPDVQVGDAVAAHLEAMVDLLGRPPVGRTSSSTPPAVFTRPNDQLAITRAPTMPITGSMNTQPNCRPAVRPTMASTDTAASAATCT